MHWFEDAVAILCHKIWRPCWCWTALAWLTLNVPDIYHSTVGCPHFMMVIYVTSKVLWKLHRWSVKSHQYLRPALSTLTFSMGSTLLPAHGAGVSFSPTRQRGAVPCGAIRIGPRWWWYRVVPKVITNIMIIIILIYSDGDNDYWYYHHHAYYTICNTLL